MTPVKGEMYTVIPHRMYDGSKTGFQCGAWHCRAKGEAFDSGITDGEWAGRKVVTVQEMKIVDGRWKPAMSTCIQVDKLRPLAVDVDLFGDPARDIRRPGPPPSAAPAAERRRTYLETVTTLAGLL